MALTPSIAILFLLIIASAMASGSEQDREVVVHEGQCPSNTLFNHIRCRRRVCLPEELVPLCGSDGDCATTHKCCRPMCSCTEQCVQAIPQSE